jgi:hypothetical protein
VLIWLAIAALIIIQTLPSKHSFDQEMRANGIILLGFIGIFASGYIICEDLGWGPYLLPSFYQCRAAASDLNDAKRFSFGEGPSWNALDIANCVMLPSDEREKKIAAIQTYKFFSGVTGQALRKRLSE